VLQRQIVPLFDFGKKKLKPILDELVLLSVNPQVSYLCVVVTISVHIK
jgi:hypothetical protein